MISTFHEFSFQTRRKLKRLSILVQVQVLVHVSTDSRHIVVITKIFTGPAAAAAAAAARPSTLAFCSLNSSSSRTPSSNRAFKSRNYCIATGVSGAIVRACVGVRVLWRVWMLFHCIYDVFICVKTKWAWAISLKATLFFVNSLYEYPLLHFR